MIRTINFGEKKLGTHPNLEHFYLKTELHNYFRNKKLVDDTIFSFSDELF